MEPEPKHSYSYEQLLGDEVSLAIVEDAREGRLDEATLHRIARIMRAFERQPSWLTEFI
jgi:hypothetical protein